MVESIFLLILMQCEPFKKHGFLLVLKVDGIIVAFEILVLDHYFLVAVQLLLGYRFVGQKVDGY